MASGYTCEFCERTFESRPVRKVVRDKRHVFCSEGCFVLWRYDRPRFDPVVVYNRYAVSVQMPPETDPPDN